MASQKERIVGLEQTIITAKTSVSELLKLARQGTTARDYDYWGTTMLNLRALKRQLEQQLPELEKLTGSPGL